MNLFFQYSDGRNRQIWVRSRLMELGISFASIARDHGWSAKAVSNALMIPSDPQEKAIAEAIGIEQRTLFPERFGANGDRLHLVRNFPSRSQGRKLKKPKAA